MHTKSPIGYSSSASAFPSFKSPPLSPLSSPRYQNSSPHNVSVPRVQQHHHAYSSPVNDFEAARVVDYSFGEVSPVLLQGVQGNVQQLSPPQSRVLDLEQQKAEAVAREDFAAAQRIKEQIQAERVASAVPAPQALQHASPGRGGELSPSLAKSAEVRRFTVDTHPGRARCSVALSEIKLSALNGAGAVHVRDVTAREWESFSCADVVSVSIGAMESRAFDSSVADPGLCVCVRLRHSSYDLEFVDPDWCLKFVNAVSGLSPHTEEVRPQSITERQSHARAEWKNARLATTSNSSGSAPLTPVSGVVQVGHSEGDRKLVNAWGVNGGNAGLQQLRVLTPPVSPGHNWYN